jgi:hypothetical protein
MFDDAKRFASRCVDAAGRVLLPKVAEAQPTVTDCVFQTGSAAFGVAATGAMMYTLATNPVAFLACARKYQICHRVLAHAAGGAAWATSRAINCWTERNRARNGLAITPNRTTTTRETISQSYLASLVPPISLFGVDVSRLTWIARIPTVTGPRGGVVSSGKLINVKQPTSPVSTGTTPSTAKGGANPEVSDSLLKRSELLAN